MSAEERVDLELRLSVGKLTIYAALSTGSSLEYSLTQRHRPLPQMTHKDAIANACCCALIIQM